MTSAARPQWKPTQGGTTIRDMATFPVAHILVRALPSHTTLKLRQEGQNAPEEIRRRDLREALTQAELDHFKKSAKEGSGGGERLLVEDGGGEHDLERVLREAAELDADSQDESGPSRSGSSEEDSSSSEEEDSEEEDDTAELLRELDKIKKERAEERERQEREAFEQAAEQRDEEIMQSNPLLPVGDRSGSFAIKRRWDDDVVFKNQAKGITERPQKRFINDIIRSDFHRRFMSKYIK